MSVVLAIETSTQVSSVAVAREGRVLAELTMQARLTHSETLLVHIDAALRMAAVKKEELSAIVISLGPGSFTGLRIGLAAAKAMAYALNIELVGVSTLAALAYNLPAPASRLGVLIDAQKGNAYYQEFLWEAGELKELTALSVRPLKEILASVETGTMLLGDLAQKKLLGKELPAGVSLAPAHLIMPRAASAALLGLKELAAGHAGSVMAMEPIYVRRSEAEVLWEKRQKELAAK